MENKTAIDWLEQELERQCMIKVFAWEDEAYFRKLLNQAKKMEKEQIIKAFGNIQRTSGYDDKGNFIISDITSEYYYEKNYGSI